MIEMLLTGDSQSENNEEKYLEFLRYLDGLNIAEVNMSFLMNNQNGRIIKVNLGAGKEEGSMVGTPWGSGTPGGVSNTGRVIRHLCPSEEVFTRLVKERRIVLLQMSITSAGSNGTTLGGLNRNGYASITGSVGRGYSYISFSTIPSLVYYDSNTDGLYSMQGSTKTGPNPWEIPS